MTAYNVVSRTALAEGETEDISVVLANFDAIAAVINGHIDESNFEAGKLYSLNRLKQGGAILDDYMKWNGSDWAPAAIAPAIELLYDTTLATDADSIVTPSLPQTYKHLEYVLMAQGTVAANEVVVNVRFNSDTTAAYAYQYHSGIAAVSGASNAVTQTSAFVGYCAAASTGGEYFSPFTGRIIGYTTGHFKYFLAQNGYFSNVASAVYNILGQWANGAAITTLTFFPTSGNFKAGTRLTVYGLR